MPDKLWKVFERRIATSLGVHRTPLSGSGSRITRSDTLHPHLYVECKKHRRLAICTWFKNTAHKAREEGKTPVMALHQFRGAHTLAVIEWDWFVDMYRVYAAWLEGPVIIRKEP